jgi:dynein heavy chain
VDLFLRAIADSQKSDDLEDRLQLLNSYFTFFLFQSVCRSLFEKDKLLFAFVIASKLQLDERKMSGEELRFLLTGGKTGRPWLNSTPVHALVRISGYCVFQPRGNERS